MRLFLRVAISSFSFLYACGVYTGHITHIKGCASVIYTTILFSALPKQNLSRVFISEHSTLHTQACRRITASAKIAPFGLYVVIAVSTIDPGPRGGA